MEKSNNYESEYIKEELKWAINGIDKVGCGLSQNIKKKLSIGYLGQLKIYTLKKSVSGFYYYCSLLIHVHFFTYLFSLNYLVSFKLKNS